MVIYHLFINGKYRFKTNSFQEILDSIDVTGPTSPNIDYVMDGLITKREFHFYDFEGNRKIDIVVSVVG